METSTLMGSWSEPGGRASQIKCCAGRLQLAKHKYERSAVLKRLSTLSGQTARLTGNDLKISTSETEDCASQSQ